jgi:hypothetical protein
MGSRWRCRAANGRARGFLRLLVLGYLGSIAVTSGARAEPVVPEARIESARGLALGTGSRASSRATHAQADNPANIVGAGVAHIESLFGYQPQLKSFAVGGSVVDAMTSGYFALGLSTRFLYGDNSAGEHSGWEGRLSVGVPIGDMLSIGVAGRYGNFTVSNPHVRPEHPPEEEGLKPDQTFKLKAFTMDGAVSLRLFEGFTISALGTNLINTDSPLAPLMVGGSAAFGTGGVSLGGDVLVDLNLHGEFSGPKLQVGGGLEFLAQAVAPLRIGYVYDQGRRTNALTCGIGYLDQRFGINASMRQLLNGAHKDTSLFFSVQYFVQ